MKTITRFLKLLALAAIFADGLSAAQATAITGSFDIFDGVSHNPALFEIRKTPTGDFFEGYLMAFSTQSSDYVVFWVTDASFEADGTVKVIQAIQPTSLQELIFDLEQQDVFSSVGEEGILSNIDQKLGPSRAAFNSPLVLNRAGSNLELSWESVPSEYYQVQTKPRMDAPWQPIVTVKAVTNSTIFVADKNSPNAQCFYRVSLAVIINGVALTPAQISGIEQRYGAKPFPGEYWYDTVSGMWGVVGFAAYSVMYPGEAFGTLQREASNPRSMDSRRIILVGFIRELWLWHGPLCRDFRWKAQRYCTPESVPRSGPDKSSAGRRFDRRKWGRPLLGNRPYGW
jgi:hypothetical protein